MSGVLLRVVLFDHLVDKNNPLALLLDFHLFFFVTEFDLEFLDQFFVELDAWVKVAHERLNDEFCDGC